ncbi:MAG: FixH family protein, partial [Chromatocurvus sp.]
MLQSRLDNTGSEPWYRQFWPWFLIVLPGTVVVASIATLIIAVRGSDDLVVDEYYK